MDPMFSKNRSPIRWGERSIVRFIRMVLNV
jgi:hypothetical protein